MARKRVDPIFAALARRRPALTSAHFGLSYEVLGAQEPEMTPDSRAPKMTPETQESKMTPDSHESEMRPDSHESGVAPGSERTLRPRPAGRLGFSVPKRQLARAVDRNALKRVAREAWRHARWGSIRPPCAAMLKLRRTEAQWKSTPRGALKKAWRVELDALFERLVASLSARQRIGSNPPRGSGPPPNEAAPVSPKSQPNRTSP